MNVLDAFKIKPFDLEPIYAEWTDGPVFKGNPKKDPPVEEWLEQIRAGCVQRKVPEEYWYKVAQHFMGPKAKARFDEVKKVIVTVNGGKYRWTWKKFKVAMTNMGWNIDVNEKETIKVRGSGTGMWFSRKKSEEKIAPAAPVKPTPQRKPPTRSNTLLWTKKPLVEEPIEEIETPGAAASRPKPSRSRTLASDTAAWLTRRDTKDESNTAEDKPARPTHQKARSETSVTKRPRSSTHSEVSRSHTTDEHGKEVSTVTNAPVWLLNAVGALDFLTNEHPKAMSVLSAVLITVGSIPAIPAVAAGAGGAILASGAAHAIGAIAVGLGQALGSSVKNSQQQQQNGSESHH
ncbi:hypothetical protein EST38_g3324 [Candolleomyces aberdarensis]|uniref:Uncharacterized protein n=1 Tax=Candolleomyces aberdarensis TaxID=2316362 RepID=A0A4Q2DQS4_9AGAR|nr:hypothetical protein EST38_g3324 [Candolleomyces aberdarensis]